MPESGFTDLLIVVAIAFVAPFVCEHPSADRLGARVSSGAPAR